jgi:hypothetical protein
VQKSSVYLSAKLSPAARRAKIIACCSQSKIFGICPIAGCTLGTRTRENPTRPSGGLKDIVRRSRDWRYPQPLAGYRCSYGRTHKHRCLVWRRSLGSGHHHWPQSGPVQLLQLDGRRRKRQRIRAAKAMTSRIVFPPPESVDFIPPTVSETCSRLAQAPLDSFDLCFDVLDSFCEIRDRLS